MSLGLRSFLIIGSLFSAYYVLRRIRSSKMSMETCIYWIIFSTILVLLGLFPGIAGWFTGLLGVQSAPNLIFLVVIFLLLIKVFLQDQRIARLDRQILKLVQEFALEKYEQNELLKKPESKEIE